MGRNGWLSLVFTALSVGLVLIIGNPVACSSSGSSPSIPGGIRLTVNNLGKNVALNSGVSKEIVFSTTNYDVEAVGGPFTELVLDLAAHLDQVSISVPGVITLPIPWLDQLVGVARADIGGSRLFIRMAPAEESASVCATGELYGPFDVTLADNLQPRSVSPPTATATQQTLDVINSGGYAVCVIIEPSVTAVADLDGLEVDFRACTEPPADMAGTWGGTYSCGGNCPEAGNILLTLDQDSGDPTRASYTDDAGARYEGRICGNRFSFRGGESGSYDESGTMVLNADGTATKTSSYASVGGGLCSGRCEDQLVLLP